MESLLQTDHWAEFKKSSGWQPKRYSGFLGLTRIVGLGKTITYFPELPFNPHTIALASAGDETPRTNIFTRLEFLEPWSQEAAGELVKAGLVKAFEDVQPDYRQWISIDQSEEKILEQMKPKGRYNVRLAERHNLHIKTGITDESIKTLFSLYGATSKRTGFKGRSLEYFQKLGAVLRDGNLGEILVITHKETPLFALMLSFHDGMASYLYGGSSSEHRELMAPYLAHFEAMKLAKKRNCVIYDLLAVAPTDKPNHIHAGLTRFKSQFGGETVRLLGSWDLVQKPFWYTLYRFAQRRRRRAI